MPKIRRTYSCGYPLLLRTGWSGKLELLANPDHPGLRPPLLKRRGYPHECYRHYLRDNCAREIYRLVAFHHDCGRGIVVLADVFEDLRVGTPAEVEPSRPRSRVHIRIVDQD